MNKPDFPYSESKMAAGWQPFSHVFFLTYPMTSGSTAVGTAD